MPSGMGGFYFGKRDSFKEGTIFMTRLGETLRAYQARDPAARSRLEIFLLYPGVHATLYHRLAHLLYRHAAEIPGPSDIPVEPVLDRH